MANASPAVAKPREVKIRVHDGVEIAVALYMPDGDGPFPVLLAPSPYRYDNNALPATPQFLWRETGPIDFYVTRGYVYAQMDVRGCGKSGGEFRLLDRNEQKDLYDVIEWLGHQPWSSGKVGGIGQSYFCMLQWWMAIQKPPSLACIAAFDGLNDPYRASVYQGGILGDFFGSYWWNQNRIINRHPANGEHPREQTCDLNLLLQQHPTYDDFWRERCAAERLDEIEVPLYSVGRLGQGRSAHPRQYRRLPPRQRSEKAEDDRPGQRLRRQPRVQQSRNSTKSCCCRSTIITSKARRPNTCRARRSNISCAAPTRSAAPRPGRRAASAT